MLKPTCIHSEAMIKNVAIQLELADALPPVEANRAQVQQILLNLISNGFDALGDLPEVRRQLTVCTAHVDTAVRVSVRDEGTGFHEADLDALFAPFRTTKPEGLGMGLAISRTIVEAHGGKIWAENNPDRGVTVHFTLPVEI